jgi:hypothetical protein
MTGNLNLEANLILTGTPTTTNQARTISFTGFDKENITDFSDAAFIRHTINTGGHSGSVLEISSQNDTQDGVAFTTHASSQVRHNGHIMWDAGNDGAGSGLDADLLDGIQSTGFLRLSDGFVDNSSPTKAAPGIFPSTAKTMIGNEYNILLNGHVDNRLTYTVTGNEESGFSVAQLKNLTDGRVEPQYSANGINPANPLVLLIEGLPSVHTQTGGVIGWTSRYWNPTSFIFEVYDTHITSR